MELTKVLELQVPPSRGRLMTASEVAEVKFEGKVSTKFVFRHVRPRQKFSANKILWYERDVDDWIRSREERAVG